MYMYNAWTHSVSMYSVEIDTESITTLLVHYFSVLSALFQIPCMCESLLTRETLFQIIRMLLEHYISHK